MPFLVFPRDHLRPTLGMIWGSGSFEVQFGDHFRLGNHFRSGIISGLEIISGLRFISGLGSFAVGDAFLN